MRQRSPRDRRPSADAARAAAALVCTTTRAARSAGGKSAASRPVAASRKSTYSCFWSISSSARTSSRVYRPNPRRFSQQLASIPIRIADASAPPLEARAGTGEIPREFAQRPAHRERDDPGHRPNRPSNQPAATHGLAQDARDEDRRQGHGQSKIRQALPRGPSANTRGGEAAAVVEPCRQDRLGPPRPLVPDDQRRVARERGAGPDGGIHERLVKPLGFEARRIRNRR